jgi:hypothetical protein
MESNQGRAPSGSPPESNADRDPDPDAGIADGLAAEAARAEAARLEAEREAERDRIAQALIAALAVGGRAHQGLLLWTVIVFLGAVAGFATGRPDAPLMLAIGGMFALAQSWDARDRARSGHALIDEPLRPGDIGRVFRILVPMIAPLLGAIFYLALGVYARSLARTNAHSIASMWCLGAAGICALLLLPAVEGRVARVLMRSEPPSHTARLAAGIAVIALLLPVPVRLMFDDFIKVLSGDNRPLVDIGGLLAQLVCEVLLAAAAVGLWVSRDARATLERLGLRRMGGRDWLIAALGLAAVIGLNAGMEWIERVHLRALWDADQEVVRMLVGKISVVGVIVLGLSAGAGEEILVRGALQPRAGMFWAAALFAAGHVQYTWFGMLTILFLGLTLGLVRRLSNTTTAIVVHMLYDVVAAFGVSS